MVILNFVPFLCLNYSTQASIALYIVTGISLYTIEYSHNIVMKWKKIDEELFEPFLEF